MGNFIAAIKAFWAVLTGAVPAQASVDAEDAVREKKAAAPEKEKEKADVSRNQFEDGAVFALALLQREGRLIDFLKEEIAGYDDAQVGAAVRQIHAGCRKVVDEHFSVQPVVDASEGQPFTVPASFDPSEFRLSGSVPATSSLKGTLQHKGWKAAKVVLPSRSGKINPKIILPAEVGF